jgi:TPR repeat protein
MYESGFGVAQDEVVAVTWFRRAAQHNNVSAETNLGIMNANGKGVTQNFAEARKWFQLAADHGDIKAQRNLGALYATGKGVPQSYADATRYYGLAAAHGDSEARTVLERIRSVQARQSAPMQRPEQHNTRVGLASAPLQPFTRLEPSAFRFSSPSFEPRTNHIGPSPSFGFGSHMMAGHFGRR